MTVKTLLKLRTVQNNVDLKHIGNKVEASVHVSSVCPANTLKTKNKMPSVLLPWFSLAPYTGRQHNRSYKTSLDRSSQPGVVSQ